MTIIFLFHDITSFYLNSMSKKMFNLVYRSKIKVCILHSLHSARLGITNNLNLILI